MNDERTHAPVSSDPKQVELDNAADLRYWSKTFAATEAQLKAAIDAVGRDPAKVREYVCKTVARP